MVIKCRNGQACYIGLALLVGTVFVGGCETTSAAGPQPVARQPQPQLELLNRVNSLETELSVLRNTVEVQENELARLRDRQSELYDNVDRRLRGVEGRSGGYGAGAYAPAGGTTADDIPPVPISPADVQRPAPAVVTAPAVQQTQAAGEVEQQEYDSAFDLLKQSRYEEAVAAFREFLNRYPGSVLADSAQYWIAEAHYVNQSYDAALHEYNILIQRYPASRKLPDAMLKVGYIHYDNQRWKEARRALNAVVARYPGSRVAVSAKLRLDQMEKQGH